MHHYRYNDAFAVADIYARQLAEQPSVSAIARRYAYRMPIDPATDRLAVLLLIAASQKVDKTAKAASNNTELEIEFSDEHSQAPMQQIRCCLEKIKDELLFCFKLQEDGQYHLALDTSKTSPFISYTNLLTSIDVDPKEITRYYRISAGHRIILSEPDGSKRLVSGEDVPEELFDRCAKQWATRNPDAPPLPKDRLLSHVSLTPEAFQTVAAQLGFLPSPLSKAFMN